MFNSILALLFLVKLFLKSKFYAPKSVIFLAFLFYLLKGFINESATTKGGVAIATFTSALSNT